MSVSLWYWSPYSFRKYDWFSVTALSGLVTLTPDLSNYKWGHGPRVTRVYGLASCRFSASRLKVMYGTGRQTTAISALCPTLWGAIITKTEPKSFYVLRVRSHWKFIHCTLYRLRLTYWLNLYVEGMINEQHGLLLEVNKYVTLLYCCVFRIDWREMLCVCLTSVLIVAAHIVTNFTENSLKVRRRL